MLVKTSSYCTEHLSENALIVKGCKEETEPIVKSLKYYTSLADATNYTNISDTDIIADEDGSNALYHIA